MVTGLAAAGYGLWSHAHVLPTAVRLLGRPDRGWLVLLALSAVLTHVCAAMCVHGSTTVRLPMMPTFAVQVAGSFANRVAPAGLGGAALNVRYLERRDVPRSQAVAAWTLNTAAGLVVHAALIALVLLVGPLSARSSLHPPRSMVLVGGAVVLLAAGAMWRWMRPRRLEDAVRRGLADVRDVLTSPRCVVRLVGGSMGITVAHAFGVYAALRTYGGRTGFLGVVAVYLLASVVGAATPAPGGLGALEGALVAGMTAVAVPLPTAVSAVIVYRLVTYWLPILPGAYAMRWLRRCHLV